MRRTLALLAAALLLAPPALVAQSAAPAAPASASATAASPGAELGAELRDAAARMAGEGSWFDVPARQAVAGPRTVAAGDTVAGDIAVVGRLDVHGTVTGDAVVYGEGSELVVHPGATIRGDAIAVLGRVRLAGGTVEGELRTVRGSLDPAPAVAPAVASAGDQLALVAGWFAVLAIMGVGVLVFAGAPLEGVVERLEAGFGRSLAAGVVGQLALAPVLLLLILALAATIIGVLLIPFAIVGFVVAAAGLMTLGFLAVTRIIGGAIGGRRRPALTERGVALRGLVVGLAIFAALWLAAAALAPVPIAASVLRGVAFAVTWVAMSAGFGAALLSRAGTRREIATVAPAPEPEPEEISWQTPTPLGGVTAARRPVSSGR